MGYRPSTMVIAPLREPQRCDQCGMFVKAGHYHGPHVNETYAFSRIDPVARHLLTSEAAENRLTYGGES